MVRNKGEFRLHYILSPIIADLISSTSLDTLKNHTKTNSASSRDSVMHLQKIKMATGPSSSAPPATLKQENTAQAGPSGARLVQRPRGNAPPASQISDDFRPDFDDDHANLTATQPLPVFDLAIEWQGLQNEKNKENLPVPKPAKKRRLNESQPGAKSMGWESQQTDPEPSSKRRRYQRPTIDEEEESVNNDFEMDTRELDPQRRKDPPPERHKPVEVPGPSNRNRTPQDSSRNRQGGGATQRRPERARSAQPANVRGAARNNSAKRGRPEADSDEEEDEDEEQAVPRPTQPRRRQRTLEADSDDEHLNPTASQVIALSKVVTARQKAVKVKGPPKKRNKWSEADTELLVELIGEYSSAWSTIEKSGDWDIERGQVALKDKARNLKVNWLR
jgi:hypothetical protein